MSKAVLPMLALAGALLSACATTVHAPSGKDAGAIGAANGEKRAEGLRFVEDHRFAEAEAILKPLLEVKPDAEIKLALGECALGLGRVEDAEPIFASLANDSTLRAKAMQGLGITHLRHGDAQGATPALEQATVADPSLWRAWNALGQAYDLQHQWDASQHAYESALRSAPDAAIIRNNMGMSFLAQERYADALKAFEAARLDNPTLEVIETNRQLALALQQRFPEATFATKPEDKARLLNNAGYVALMKGDYDHAEQLFVEAAETSPTYYVPAHENMEFLQQLRAKALGKRS
jgi:Flp pilus assembly protein TadD